MARNGSHAASINSASTRQAGGAQGLVEHRLQHQVAGARAVEPPGELHLGDKHAPFAERAADRLGQVGDQAQLAFGHGQRRLEPFGAAFEEGFRVRGHHAQNDYIMQLTWQ